MGIVGDVKTWQIRLVQTKWIAADVKDSILDFASFPFRNGAERGPGKERVQIYIESFLQT